MARRKSAKRGRGKRRGQGKGVVVNHPGGIRCTGIRGDARLTAAALSSISPTPHGPEPHWPAG
jgi:hypothetical protein